MRMYIKLFRQDSPSKVDRKEKKVYAKVEKKTNRSNRICVYGHLQIVVVMIPQLLIFLANSKFVFHESECEKRMKNSKINLWYWYLFSSLVYVVGWFIFSVCFGWNIPYFHLCNCSSYGLKKKVNETF